MFFALSGYLISASSQRRSPVAFWRARLLRIFPGLIVSTLATALVLAVVSDLDLRAYLTSLQTWKYVFGTGTLAATEYALPGVFQRHAVTQANGSLWTLRYEVACYVAIFALVWATRLIRLDFGKAALAGALVCAGVHTALIASGKPFPVQIDNILPLFVPFALGAWLQARSAAPRGWHVLAAIAFAAAVSQTALYT